VVQLDDDLPLLDHEHAEPGVVGADQHLAGRNLDLGGDLRERLQRLVRQLGEERDLA
jgi:hypothetical protein